LYRILGRKTLNVRTLYGIMTHYIITGPNLFLGSKKQYYLMANVLSALPPAPPSTGMTPAADAASPAAAAAAAKVRKGMQQCCMCVVEH